MNSRGRFKVNERLNAISMQCNAMYLYSLSVCLHSLLKLLFNYMYQNPYWESSRSSASQFPCFIFFFITMFTRAHHLSLSWDRSMQSVHPLLTYQCSTINLFPSCFVTNFNCSATLHPYHPHYFIILSIFGDEWKLWIFFIKSTAEAISYMKLWIIVKEYKSVTRMLMPERLLE